MTSRRVRREGQRLERRARTHQRTHYKVPFPLTLFTNPKIFYLLGLLAMGASIFFIGFAGAFGTSRSSGDSGSEDPESAAEGGTPAEEATEEDAESGTQGAVLKQYDAPPAMTIDPSRQYEAVIVTSRGEVRIRLRADKAPATVNNFIFLARDGFYDGLSFFRVVPDFVVQAGDPTGSGAGDPGYTLPGEVTDLPLTAGAIAMARDNRSNEVNGSQFFITLEHEPQLAAESSPFGEVLSGLDVLQALVAGDVIERVIIEES